MVPEPSGLPRHARAYLDDLPDVYVVAAEGRCMEPVAMEGDKVVFSKVERPRAGDYAAFFLAEPRHGILAWSKRLERDIPPTHPSSMGNSGGEAIGDLL
jgi:hypothetical protein